jgi:hypothetical protein
MVDGWGHCMHCKHFDSPAQLPLAMEEASCQHPALEPYQLRVFGTSGCSGFELREGISYSSERANGHVLVEAR